MIQDIAAHPILFPKTYPTKGDYVLQCKGDRIAFTPWTRAATTVQPLVRVGDLTVFLGASPDAKWETSQSLRRLPTPELRFAGFCAHHLAQWLLTHRWCGKCGALLSMHTHSLKCTACQHEVFPTIAPAVIVGLIHQGKLLVTRYADRPYRGPALVAGYCEVGESAERTCVREALEETGLHVVRTRYFASQPWGLSGSLLLGYFAETANAEVRLADGELAEAVWLSPEDVPPPPDPCGALSLTATMIQAFARGEGGC